MRPMTCATRGASLPLRWPCYFIASYSPRCWSAPCRGCCSPRSSAGRSSPSSTPPSVFEQARTPQAVEPARGEVQAHDHGAHVHSATAWEPAEGAERIGFTVLSNVLTAAGFALIMLVAMAAALRRRDTATQRKAAARLDWRYGLLWGLAGYAVFFVAPALGLRRRFQRRGSGASRIPPALVDVDRGLYGSRSHGGGILQIPVALDGPCTAGGAVLAGAPHLGASAFAEYPPAAAAEMTELAKRFVWATAITNGVFWIVPELCRVGRHSGL